MGWKKFKWWHYICSEQCNPNTRIVLGQRRRLCWKINQVWSHSMKVSSSAYELFSQPSYIYIYIYREREREMCVCVCVCVCVCYQVGCRWKIRRCMWCNVYPRRKWSRWPEFKPWTWLFFANTLEKGMNPIIVPPAMGK